MDVQRRADTRKDVSPTPVQLSGPDKRFLGFARNVSRSGVFLETFIPHDIGEEIDIEFTLPDTNISIKCRSVIMWCQYPWNTAAAAKQGLRFLDIDPAVAERIDVWVKAPDKPAVHISPSAEAGLAESTDPGSAA